MHSRSLGLFIALMSGLACSGTNTSRELPAETLSAALWASRTDTLAGEYTRVVRPAEFWDSVLVVPDVGEQSLWRVNIATGQRLRLGSRGGGPGEYPRVSRALKVHSDSVAIVQGSAFSPFAIVSVATGIGRTQRFDASADLLRTRAPSLPHFQFADTLGNLYASVTQYHDELGERPWPKDDPPNAVATAPLLRLSVRSGLIDTAGFVPVTLRAPDPFRAARTPGVRARVSMGPYSPYNAWIVLSDGRAVLAGGAGYVLEMMDASGALNGPWTVEHPIVHASQAGYDAWIQHDRRTSAALVSKTMAGANVTKTPTQDERTYPAKPDKLPPLNLAGVRTLHGTQGTVWIPVHVEDPPSREIWDIVDIDRGERTCRVALEQNQRLLLVSANAVYVAALNESDLERIVLYRPANATCAVARR